MRRDSVGFTLVFAAAVCVVCAVVVSGAAVSLQERQAVNAELDRKKNVLAAAGMLQPDETVSPEEIEARFDVIQAVAVDLATGAEDPEVDTSTFDQRKAATDPSTSRQAPANAAGVTRIPDRALVYQVRSPDGALELLILPVEGRGLWSTLYGYLALAPDLDTIRGITFYQHGETAGLGGEVDNPRWKALWVGRKAFDAAGEPVIAVARGRAGTVQDDPHRVDGLSGATLTGNGVTYLVRFWLGPDAFGPYLDRLRGSGDTAVARR